MISRLYAIVDAQVLARHGVALKDFAIELRAAGVELVQYRDKVGAPQEVLWAAEVLRGVFGDGDTPHDSDDETVLIVGHPRPLLVMNDRADLAALAGFDGVHVGQEDLLPADARRVVGASRWVGVSTHTDAQVRVAEASCADYVAIGPVFVTGTKADAEQVVGLEGVRQARTLTTKPLVAIGGITRANARSVIAAGADSVAVISGFFSDGESVEQVARDFLEHLR